MATVSSKGFMSSILYKNSVKSFSLKGGDCIQLYKQISIKWIRKGGAVFVSNEKLCAVYAFCVIQKNNEETAFSIWKTYGDFANIEFYKKGDNLYLLYNSEEGNYVSVIGFSSEDLVYINSKIDSSYTKISVL